MYLKNKNAVLFGGGGGIGRGVALTFAREGARVFLTGRTREKLAAAAAQINADVEVQAAGGSVEIGVVDALDEQAVEAFVGDVVARAGSIDVAFHLIARGDVQGIPLVEMSAADYTRAVLTGLSGAFITARAAARRMIDQGSGVILMITSGSSNGAMPMIGSTPPADAAMEALMRNLAAEVGPHGVRVLGIWTAGVAETLTPQSIGEVNSAMQLDEAGVQQIIQAIAGATMLRRPITLAQVAETAAFLASDRASGITGTMINVTSGMVAV